MIRFRIPRPNPDAVLCTFVYLTIAGLFGVVAYMFWMIHTSFNRMEFTLRGLFP